MDKEINLDKALFELSQLVDDCKLTHQQRLNQKLNIQALQQIIGEWKELKNGKENK